MKKTALITGVLGQDGAYLAEFLLKKNYRIIGISKNHKTKEKWRLTKLGINDKIIFENLDVCKIKDIKKIFEKYSINEVYNFAAKSYVTKSIENPVETISVNINSVVRILDFIKKHNRKIKFYQASSSEMFGNTKQKFYDGKINFDPNSPYAISKLSGHYITKFYRETFKIYAISGILFNHESPLRNNDFVIKKIVVGLVNIIKKKQKLIEVGNIFTKRDWGYAKDYTHIIWRMLQKKTAKDFIIATGRLYSIKEFIDIAVKYLKIDVIWVGKGLESKLILKKNKKIILRINKKFLRKNEIKNPQNSARNFKNITYIRPKTNFKDLVKLMIDDEKISNF